MRQRQSQSDIRAYYNAVGPILRGVMGGIDRAARYAQNRFASSDEMFVNERVNNMSEQQFEDHMNELFMRDN